MHTYVCDACAHIHTYTHREELVFVKLADV